MTVAGCAALGLSSARIGALPEPTIVAGLKEALRIGVERSVTRAARPGGFLDDPQLRIRLPSELETAVKGLRAIGLGSAAEEVELAMNRAAERAAGEATDLLQRAVAELAIDDAISILRGPDDAATAYLRGRSEGALRERFEPIVRGAMREVGLSPAYDELLARFRVLEAAAIPQLSLERYVSDATLAGLFSALAAEEARIRRDPAARTTQLLREVFGTG